MRVIPIVICLLFYQWSVAQTIGRTDWATEKDFRDAEPMVIQNILWLEENPLANESNDTKAISEYVIEWLSESPYITVRFDEVFTSGIIYDRRYKYADKFRVTYLFGKSLHVMLNPSKADEGLACIRGVEGMIRVYEELLKFDSEAKRKELDNYLRLYKNGQLESYVRSQLNESGG